MKTNIAPWILFIFKQRDTATKQNLTPDFMNIKSGGSTQDFNH
jgi:hypothetical protein